MTPDPTTDPRWSALMARDPEAPFLYGVLTTGVYCRPTCPSRRPRPENVRYFDDPAAAEAAGFRPCKRCRPGRPDPAVERAVQIAAHLAEGAREPFDLPALARRFGVGPTHLSRSFQAVLGVGPRAFHAAQREALLRAGLRRGETVLRAILEAGYGSTSRVYEADPLAMAPQVYRRGGDGERIAFALRDTVHGPLLMAATDRGVCFAAFGDARAALPDALAAAFPNAALEPSQGPVDDWVTALEAHLADGRPAPEVPLDLRGTAFQLRVWRFLRGIPPGQRRSYAAVGDALGSGPRAVGGAVAANRVAVLVPCHRVLRGDGGLGGYRWGVARKAVLLARETA
jgi:AraC family transcriptional regulator of adaptative response/methylated-DNA-[protein]-cysteine methyltransferase